jgi:Tol biopolymer transport system component
MAPDLRELIASSAPRPSRPLDTNVILRRGRYLQWRRRITAAFLAALVPLGVATGIATLPESLFNAEDSPDSPAAPNGSITGMSGKIVFAGVDQRSSRDSSLNVMDPDGGNLRTILSRPSFGHQMERPAWSPDGDRIAFNAYLPDDDTGEFEDFLNSEIFVASADGSGRGRLTYDSEPVVAPVWSPDGARIVFARADDAASWELWIMDADGSDPELLTDETTGGDASWSPDGRWIVYSQFLYRRGERRSYNQELFVMDVNKGAVTQLTETIARESTPTWSPDGSRIAYLCSDGEAYALCVIDLDAATMTTVIDDGVRSVSGPAWSPDGRHIAVVTTDRTSDRRIRPHQWNDQIVVVRASGGEPQPIGPSHFIIFGIDWR